jgi:hypothetical protein
MNPNSDTVNTAVALPTDNTAPILVDEDCYPLKKSSALSRGTIMFLHLRKMVGYITAKHMAERSGWNVDPEILAHLADNALKR